MLKAIGKVFVAIGKALVRVFKVAEERGLTEDIVNHAEAPVGEAQKQFNDNDTKREWAVAALVAAKVPESIARLAVELAVQLFKSLNPLTEHPQNPRLKIQKPGWSTPLLPGFRVSGRSSGKASAR